MDKIRAWLWWWFVIDGITAEYIRYKQPNESLLTRYLTRHETTSIPWEELDAIELPKRISRSMIIECRDWLQLNMNYAERNFYISRLSDQYMYRLYVLREKQEQEKHDAWLKEFMPDSYELIMNTRNMLNQKYNND